MKFPKAIKFIYCFSRSSQFTENKLRVTYRTNPLAGESRIQTSLRDMVNVMWCSPGRRKRSNQSNPNVDSICRRNLESWNFNMFSLGYKYFLICCTMYNRHTLQCTCWLLYILYVITYLKSLSISQLCTRTQRSSSSMFRIFTTCVTSFRRCSLTRLVGREYTR